MAYDVKNVELHGSDCGELNFPLGRGGTVPDLESVGHRLISDCEWREDSEARERRDAATAAALAGLNPELVEKERQRLEEFAEAKRKANTTKNKGVADATGSSTASTPARVREEDIGSSADPSTAPTIIKLDNDSCSSFECDED